ncbi:hypothetical protein QM467_08740 [Rhodoblastus sp. 17X3]|uniref:hypothetical protein n=1 Tax=Rhodoblastus sp. 17X3 TaxID=3047026 RepID=UPI0024B77221|nr:hypothetical protein [Rhodoblastus sp. 17X3]MDI9848135.1 hypothetical protein [Rhodoblastus sp. 17X3]
MARDRWRARLEDGLKLDLNKLIRDGVLRPGSTCRASIRWANVYSSDESAAGVMTAHMCGKSYGWLELEVDGRRQEIALESQSRHFGGRQWYFVCPRLHCLVSVLWRPYGASAFASRQAWGRRVAYGSQFETWHDRAITQARHVRRKLGGEDWELSYGDPMPEKPKGMHWRTYERKIKRINRYESICNQQLIMCLARFLR